jgi:hypothetical protein
LFTVLARLHRFSAAVTPLPSFPIAAFSVSFIAHHTRIH